MCGIWAIFGSEKSVCEQCMACMKIKHRGPDAFRIENVNHFVNCCFGFHRLAILDDAHGMQPMKIHALPHLWLCYNGEIYNYKLNQKVFNFSYETECDGESILHLYDHGGIDFATKHLDGVFAFILLDTANNKVYIGRDTYGVKPAFRLYTQGGFFGVCSEAKGLMDFFQSQDEAVIEQLTPGHYETYDLADTGKVTFREKICFHTLGQEPVYKTMISSYEDDVSVNIRNLLSEAVRKRMVAHRRIGCLLSGGLDSSLTAALVMKHAKDMGLSYPVQTFSIGMESSPDIIAATKVAAHIGSEHHERIFTAEEGISNLCKVIYHLECYDIITVRASVAMFMISELISSTSDCVVLMSGEGADEVGQGYLYFHKAPTPEEADRESRRLLQELYLMDILRADRTTAAAGLELRVPFLDHQFTSYYLSLPCADRQPQKGIEKYLIRKAFDGTDTIPDDILWRPKEGFSDGLASVKKSWFSHMQEFAETEITDADMDDRVTRFPFNPPGTKEAYLYRQMFEEMFPGQSHWTPHYWIPRWTNATDPSPRWPNGTDPSPQWTNPTHPSPRWTNATDPSPRWTNATDPSPRWTNVTDPSLRWTNATDPSPHWTNATGPSICKSEH